jgi:hypothetical protein
VNKHDIGQLPPALTCCKRVTDLHALLQLPTVLPYCRRVTNCINVEYGSYPLTNMPCYSYRPYLHIVGWLPTVLTQSRGGVTDFVTYIMRDTDCISIT